MKVKQRSASRQRDEVDLAALFIEAVDLAESQDRPDLVGELVEAITEILSPSLRERTGASLPSLQPRTTSRAHPAVGTAVRPGDEAET